MCNSDCSREQKVKDIRDIQLGDILRILGKERLVIATYDHNNVYSVLTEANIGWKFEQQDLLEYTDVQRYKADSNIKDFIGKTCWWYQENLNDIECIVKKANCCGNNACVSVQSNVRQERPCPRCGRKNDIGVKECWNCVYPNP